ncbi:MAG TPA: methyltransferase domain-containing protein [Myxococcota bacterium]|nr:methyltransferase domain-containing protein [Myxococcota bacterium]HOA14044.1 methyltransferase domain-containing protein [Myxococcota bacterium]HOC98502.1 methyltransferase domain-containing protein [Myxococcota bacterium]HOH77284.1 methyltransferase domain-containing protein [Myxococcota bacterium]HPV03061.1 methyltransferase domain-containing protein [Myxococcota bacterium]
MDRNITPDNFEAWNDEMGRKFDPDAYHNHPNPLIRNIERKRVRTVLKFIKPTEGQRVLEVGCGAGNVLEQIVGADLTGIDLSDHLLEKARERLRQRARLLKADAAALPFEDGWFGVVYCTEVLEHVLDPRAVIREMRRVLRPDGVAVVSIPNESVINGIKGHFLDNPIGRVLLNEKPGTYHSSKKMDDEWHLHSFDLKMLKCICEGVFRIDRLAAIPSPVLPIRYVARLAPIKPASHAKTAESEG